MMDKRFNKECERILDENGYTLLKASGSSSLLVNQDHI